MKNGKSIVRRIISALEWILLILSMAFLINIFVVTSKGKAVKLFGNSLLHVITGSMEPTISVEDYILVKETDVNTLETGDIIAFYSSVPTIKGMIVIHRIIDINDDGTFKTMGDANPVPDDYPVEASSIVGKYERRSWLFNWMASFMEPKKLLLILAVVPIFLLSIYEAGTLTKLIRKQVKEENASEDGADGEDESTAPDGETREEKIERLKREAVEEYLKKQTAENGDAETGANGSDSTDSENNARISTSTVIELFADEEESDESNDTVDLAGSDDSVDSGDSDDEIKTSDSEDKKENNK